MANAKNIKPEWYCIGANGKRTKCAAARLVKAYNKTCHMAGFSYCIVFEEHIYGVCRWLCSVSSFAGRLSGSGFIRVGAAQGNNYYVFLRRRTVITMGVFCSLKGTSKKPSRIKPAAKAVFKISDIDLW